MSFEVGRTLNTNESFCLNIESVVTGRTFIASITRMGKSWTDRKIIEHCFGHAGIIIVDPEGEYSSLREKFAFLIIGKDIPLQLETAEFMAEEILKTKTSVIIDLSMVEDDEFGKEYVNRFLRRFFFLETTARQPYLIVVEEAEDFCGEKGITTETCLHILINIVKKGGKRGIGAIFIAHRPAWVSKGILSQCANKAIGKVESTDFKALENYARVPSETIEKLPSLGPGEFCFTGDWVKEPVFVKIGQVQTTHLGYTPKVIPPSPKGLQEVIMNLQKALPDVIEKIKPTVVPIEKMKEELRVELENKYKARIEAIQRAANEKAERKFKVEMDNLKEVNDKLSRSQALQPTAPITDVLEHPIVRTRMSELPEKTRDLLIKIEREPNLTRQQLAAFLTTSTDSIGNLINTINRLFRAEVIVGDGKPMKYRSMLKRLFLTDVAKREIQELQRLQEANSDLQTKNNESSEKVGQLRIQVGELTRKASELEPLRTALEKANSKISNTVAENQRLIEERKEIMLAGKAGEALATVVNTIIDRRLSGFNPGAPSLDLSNVHELIVNEVTAKLDLMREGLSQKVAERVNEAIAKLPPGAYTPTPGEPSSTSITLEHKVTHFDLQKTEVHLKTDTANLQGQILKIITEDFFDKRHTKKEVMTELTNHAWIHNESDVENELMNLCQIGVFSRKVSTGKAWWYTLQPEAKNLIHA